MSDQGTSAAFRSMMCHPSPYNPFSNMADFPTHKSEGARKTMHGFHFQFKTTMLWILRALRSECVDFEVSTEDQENFGKFDDFYIKERDSEGKTIVQRFVQIKSGSKDKAITFEHLFNVKNNVNIIDLFLSFAKLDKEKIFSEEGDKKFVLYTNRKLDFESGIGNVSLGQCLTKSTSQKDALLNFDCFQFQEPFTDDNFIVQKLMSLPKATLSQVELFLRHFIICTDSTKENRLESDIKTELHSLFQPVDVERAYSQYFTDLQRWFTLPKGTVLNREAVNKYFKDLCGAMDIKRYFQILSPTKNFCGREQELDKVHEELTSPDKTCIVDVVVSGTAGVGKSELIRKYIERHGAEYEHVIWLNGESRESLISSFSELALFLNISEREDKKIKSTDVLVMKVYGRLQKHKCLLVFDNASSKLYDNQIFLGGTLNPNHRVLATTQVQDLECAKEIKLDVFTPDEACNLLEANLQDFGYERKTAEELTSILSHLPLALQLAISYIKEAGKRRKIMSKDSFTIKDFISEFKQKSDKFINHSFGLQSLDHYRIPLTTAWKMAVSHLKTEKNGESAVELLAMIAYLEPDDINLGMFKDLDQDELCEAAFLLQNYSLVKIESGVCSIHGLIQEVIRFELKLSNDERPRNECFFLETTTEETVLMKTVNNICCPLRSTDLTVSIFDENLKKHIFKIWTYLKRYDNLKKEFFQLDSQINFITLFDASPVLQNQHVDIHIGKLEYLLAKAQQFLTHDILNSMVTIALYYHADEQHSEIILLFVSVLSKPFTISDLLDSAPIILSITHVVSLAFYRLGRTDNAFMVWSYCLHKFKFIIRQSHYAFDPFTRQVDILGWIGSYQKAHEMMSEILIHYFSKNHNNQVSSFVIPVESREYFASIFVQAIKYKLFATNRKEETMKYIKDTLKNASEMCKKEKDHVFLRLMLKIAFAFCVTESLEEEASDFLVQILNSHWEGRNLTRYHPNYEDLIIIENIIRKFSQPEFKINLLENTFLVIALKEQNTGYDVDTLVNLFCSLRIMCHGRNLVLSLACLSRLSNDCKYRMENPSITDDEKNNLRILYREVQLSTVNVLREMGDRERALYLVDQLFEDADWCPPTFRDTLPFEKFRLNILEDHNEFTRRILLLINLCEENDLEKERLFFRVTLCDALEKRGMEKELQGYLDEWMVSDGNYLNISLKRYRLRSLERVKCKALSEMIIFYEEYLNDLYVENFSLYDITRAEYTKQIQIFDLSLENWPGKDQTCLDFLKIEEKIAFIQKPYENIINRVLLAFQEMQIGKYKEALLTLRDITKALKLVYFRYHYNHMCLKEDIERLYKAILYKRLMDKASLSVCVYTIEMPD